MYNNIDVAASVDDRQRHAEPEYRGFCPMITDAAQYAPSSGST